MTKLKQGLKIVCKFDKTTHEILKVTGKKIYYSENPDGTGKTISNLPSVIIECFEIIKPHVKDLPEEKKPLFLVMQDKYFTQILRGQKTSEFREDSPFYRSRFLNKEGEIKNFKTVLLQLGYHTNARKILVEVKKITGDGIFEVYLGQILERINF